MFIQISSMIMLVWLNMVSVLQLFHVYVTWTWYSSTWVWSQSLTWIFLQIVHVFNRISDCSLLVSLFECHYPSIYIQRRFGQLCHALEISIFFKCLVEGKKTLFLHLMFHEINYTHTFAQYLILTFDVTWRLFSCFRIM